MAKSRLHQLAERGQSVWIDFLSREFVHGGELAPHDRRGRRHRHHLEPFDLPVGDREGARVRRADEGAARDDRRPGRDLLRARGRRRARRVRRAAAGLGARRTGRTATSRSRSTRRSRTRPTRRWSRRSRCTTQVDRPNVLIKIPATRRGPARDRGLDRARRLDQHHADLLARALRGRRRGVHPRPRAARRRRRRPVEGRVGRVVLRLAHRHRDRQAARRGRQHGAAGQARRRQREARLQALPGGLRRPALGGARREGRDRAAAAVGLDLDEEPGLSATRSTSRS